MANLSQFAVVVFVVIGLSHKLDFWSLLEKCKSINLFS